MDDKRPVSLLQEMQTPTRMWWKPVLGVVMVFVLLGMAWPWLVGPACPKRVVIATGNEVGAYYAFGQRYRDVLERAGIQLEVRSTAGSVENSELLQDASSDVSLAIMQGGTAGVGNRASLNVDDSSIQSLASLFLEPIWVFYREETPINRLAELRGKRVAIGAKGSGTRAMALELLADNGFHPETTGTSVESLEVAGEVELPKTKLLGPSSQAAADALKAGDVDVAFFVLAPTAPLITELMRDPNIRLLNFDRALAYKRRHPYLTSVTIYEGMLDLKRNLPAKDIELLAPTAALVARQDLHPALVPLFLKAASQIHEGGGILEAPREFPSENHVEYPMNAAASSFLRSGPSFLYRTFPFGIASWLDRMKLMLVPLCTLLIPLVKAAPPLYRWRIRSKIYTWYRVLRQVDQARREPEGLELAAPFIDQLKHVENELAEISVPLSYMEEFYNLRWHVAFVLEQLERQQQDTLSVDSRRSENANQSDIRQNPQSPLQIPRAA